MERKPYYITRISTGSFDLKEGIPYPQANRRGGGTTIQLDLTDEEVQKYNSEKVKEILKPYIEVTKKRYMYLPSEVLLYAIKEVLYD